MAGTDQTELRTNSWQARLGYEEEPRHKTLDAEQRAQVEAIRVALAAAQPAQKVSPRQLVYEHLAPDIREAAARGLTYSAIQKILAQNQLEINADTLRIYASKAPRKPAPLPKPFVARETRGPHFKVGTTDIAPTKSAPDPPPADRFNTESNAGGSPVVSKRVR